MFWRKILPNINDNYDTAIILMGCFLLCLIHIMFDENKIIFVSVNEALEMC